MTYYNYAAGIAISIIIVLFLFLEFRQDICDQISREFVYGVDLVNFNAAF